MDFGFVRTRAWGVSKILRFEAMDCKEWRKYNVLNSSCFFSYFLFYFFISFKCLNFSDTIAKREKKGDK